MRYSTKQKKVINGLENLVHSRFNLESLTEHLTKLMGESIILSDTTDDKCDDDTSDWNLLFVANQNEIYGYFDIFYLKMRKPGYANEDIYVTEISYQFE